MSKIKRYRRMSEGELIEQGDVYCDEGTYYESYLVGDYYDPDHHHEHFREKESYDITEGSWRIHDYSLYEAQDAHQETRNSWFSIKDEQDLAHLSIELRIAQLCRTVHRAFEASEDPNTAAHATEYALEMRQYLTWLESNWN